MCLLLKPAAAGEIYTQNTCSRSSGIPQGQSTSCVATLQDERDLPLSRHERLLHIAYMASFKAQACSQQGAADFDAKDKDVSRQVAQMLCVWHSAGVPLYAVLDPRQ